MLNRLFLISELWYAQLNNEIKLDAMFSPVVKATYKIENSRVGQVTDYDKLIFEVETNGVISILLFSSTQLPSSVFAFGS